MKKLRFTQRQGSLSGKRAFISGLSGKELTIGQRQETAGLLIAVRLSTSGHTEFSGRFTLVPQGT